MQNSCNTHTHTHTQENYCNPHAHAQLGLIEVSSRLREIESELEHGWSLSKSDGSILCALHGNWIMLLHTEGSQSEGSITSIQGVIMLISLIDLLQKDRARKMTMARSDCPQSGHCSWLYYCPVQLNQLLLSLSGCGLNEVDDGLACLPSGRHHGSQATVHISATFGAFRG